MHDTAAVSPDHFENQIRQRFLGHICETCQKISVDGFSEDFFPPSIVWTRKCGNIYVIYFLFFCSFFSFIYGFMFLQESSILSNILPKL